MHNYMHINRLHAPLLAPLHQAPLHYTEDNAHKLGLLKLEHVIAIADFPTEIS